MTVVENMLVFAPEHAAARRSPWARGRISGAAVARALGILREFGLAARADDWAQDLGAPELKMLEFARATMAAPRLMMLDEPAAGVNPALMENLAAQIRGLRDRGVTFLVVDHNLKFISAVCEEVFAMADGRVIARGSCAEVIANPEVVRLYIGSGEEGGRPARRAAS
jgi:ABC-type branched-subunit amino acid transport system ATPase component